MAIKGGDIIDPFLGKIPSIISPFQNASSDNPPAVFVLTFGHSMILSCS